MFLTFVHITFVFYVFDILTFVCYLLHFTLTFICYIDVRSTAADLDGSDLALVCWYIGVFLYWCIDVFVMGGSRIMC